MHIKPRTPMACGAFVPLHGSYLVRCASRSARLPRGEAPRVAPVDPAAALVELHQEPVAALAEPPVGSSDLTHPGRARRDDDVRERRASRAARARTASASGA